jgi:STE24 endopeptidase
MTTMNAHLIPAAGVIRRGHFGAWRAVAAAPAMVGSLLLLLVLFGWMGQWEGLVLLAWLASGAAVFTRIGERFAVAAGCGFRRPTKAQAAALQPVWEAALARSGAAPGDVDLYVQRSNDLNAYAAGGRSVAVTSGVLRQFLARRLGSAEMGAVLVHELGHHSTRATRFALVAIWLALPWRFASRLVIGIALATVGRRQPMRLLGVVAAATVVVAVVQAIQQRQFAVALVLGTVAVSAVVCPLADAGVSRRSEYAADRFTAGVGAGSQLADALRQMDRGAGPRQGWTQRALNRHPSVERRVAAIERYAARANRT